jgi:predicted MPP superfamily phosphohydrolase
MKILHLTDLHLEWNKNLIDFSTVIDVKVAKVVVLTGDIAGGTHALPFIKHLISLGYIVIYVLGNHEFYGHNVDDLIKEWREISKDIENFHFLEGESVVIDDVEFFGTCLWTSMGTSSKEDFVDFYLKLKIKKSDDFTLIKNWSVDKMKDRFYDAWSNLQKMIENSTANKKVVLMHYLPSYQSIHECYINSPQNPMFATELSNYFAYSDVDAIFHGHTHTSCRYMMNNCLVTCNPYGYHDNHMRNPNFSWTDSVTDI